MMSLHARATGEIEHDRLVARIKCVLRERFGVEHATLQVEYGEECLDDHVQPRTPESADDKRTE